MKWLCPTETSAFTLHADLTAQCCSAHKMRFSTMALAGMVVRWEVLREKTRVWLVFWAEPEAELEVPF